MEPGAAATAATSADAADGAYGGSSLNAQDDRRQADRRGWLQITLLVVLIAAAGGALWYWREPLWALFGDQERVRRWLSGFGPWAPLVSIGLNAAQVLLAPIPGQFVGMANGYLYGVWLGTFYSMLGLALGRGLAMALGRWCGRRLVERLIDPEQLARWDKIAHRQGPLFLFLVFLFPSLPDDTVCFLIGLSPLSIPPMLILSLLGGLPGVFVSCWIGASAPAWPWWAWIPLGGGMAALAWAFWRYRAVLEATLVRLIQKLTGKHQDTL